MQVTVEDVSSVKKILHIEVPENIVIRELDNAYENLKKTAKIRGFRPGKAPRSVLERLFKKDVHGDVSSKLLQDSFVEALKETDLNIIGNPQIEPPQLEEKGPYKYDATVEVKPEIDDIDFRQNLFSDFMEFYMKCNFMVCQFIIEVVFGEIDGYFFVFTRLHTHQFFVQGF